MSSRWETFIANFDGGMITNLPYLEHARQFPGSARFLQNMEPSLQGGYQKILGYSKFSETEVTGTGQIHGVHILVDGTVVAARGSDIYTSTGTTWTKRTGSSLSSAPLFLRAVTYRFSGTTESMLVDGANDPYQIDHNTKTLAQLTTPPSDVSAATHIEAHAQRLWFGKGPILTYTAPNTDNDFNTGNGAGTINVGDVITGIKSFKNVLFIFCRNQIKTISGSSSSDFVLRDFSKTTGCENGDTIQEVGGDLFYLSFDGVRTISDTDTSGEFQTNPQTLKVKTEFDFFTSDSNDFSSCTVSSKNQYRIFGYKAALTPTVSGGFLATKFGQEKIDWARLKGFKVYDVDQTITSSNEELIVFCSDDGYVYKMEDTNGRDGSGISWIYTGPHLFINDPFLRKTQRKLRLYGNFNQDFSANIKALINFSSVGNLQPDYLLTESEGGDASTFGSSFAVYGTSVYSTGITNFTDSMLIGNGETFSYNIYGTDTNDPVLLRTLAIEYSTKGRQ